MSADGNWKITINTPMGARTMDVAITTSGDTFTGGGKGAGMVYVAGKPDHKQDNDGMVDHIVQLVEARAEELAAAKLLEAAE